MAEQEPTKREQAPGMNPDHTTKDIPVLQNPPSLGAEEASIDAGVTLEPELQAHIGRQLRAVYDGVVNEPVPDRFLKLLETLEREQAGSS